MRVIALALAFALVACGASTQSSDDVPDGDALPYGAISVIGENWGLNADPDAPGVSLTSEDGTELSGPWAAPQAVDGGYRMVAGPITLDVQETPCQMNGMPWPMTAQATFNGRTLPGCAAMRWDYQLVALMPQIDACLAQSADTPTVSYAGTQTDGSVLVRMQGSEVMKDCRVTNGAAVVTPRTETLFVATDHEILFQRASATNTQNPGGECYDAPEVRGANDELLGWKLDPLGC